MVRASSFNCLAALLGMLKVTLTLFHGSTFNTSQSVNKEKQKLMVMRQFLLEMDTIIPYKKKLERKTKDMFSDTKFEDNEKKY